MDPESHDDSGEPRSVEEPLNYVIPAWTAGIQADTDVCGRILRTWMPAIHAGMTMICTFHFLWASVRS